MEAQWHVKQKEGGCGVGVGGGSSQGGQRESLCQTCTMTSRSATQIPFPLPSSMKKNLGINRKGRLEWTAGARNWLKKTSRRSACMGRNHIWFWLDENMARAREKYSVAGRDFHGDGGHVMIIFQTGQAWRCWNEKYLWKGLSQPVFLLPGFPPFARLG